MTHIDLKIICENRQSSSPQWTNHILRRMRNDTCFRNCCFCIYFCIWLLSIFFRNCLYCRTSRTHARTHTHSQSMLLSYFRFHVFAVEHAARYTASTEFIQCDGIRRHICHAMRLIRYTRVEDIHVFCFVAKVPFQYFVVVVAVAVVVIYFCIFFCFRRYSMKHN